jgi:hypothetical protein
MKEHPKTPQDITYETLVHLKLFQKQKFSHSEKSLDEVFIVQAQF